MRSAPVPPRRLQDGNPRGVDRVAEDEIADVLAIVGQTVDRQVAFGDFSFDQSAFRLFDAPQNRRQPRSVLVDTDAEVHFVGVAVGVERLGQTEDRVGRGGGDVRESRGHWSWQMQSWGRSNGKQ